MSLIARLLRLVSLIACGVIIISFVFFATDLAGEASEGQRDKVADSLEPNPSTETRRERSSGGFREAVDDANDVLLAPFTPAVEDRDIWFQRIALAVFGVLVYGLGLALIANVIRK